jgi:hypothetical protein
VLEVTLPPKIVAAVAPQVSSSPSTPSPTGDSSTPADPSETEPASRDAWPWVAGGLLGLVALLVLLRGCGGAHPTTRGGAGAGPAGASSTSTARARGSPTTTSSGSRAW